MGPALKSREGPFGETLSVDFTQHLVYSTATRWALPVGQAVGMCSNHRAGGPGQAGPEASAWGQRGEAWAIPSTGSGNKGTSVGSQLQIATGSNQEK